MCAVVDGGVVSWTDWRESRYKINSITIPASATYIIISMDICFKNQLPINLSFCLRSPLSPSPIATWNGRRHEVEVAEKKMLSIAQSSPLLQLQPTQLTSPSSADRFDCWSQDNCVVWLVWPGRWETYYRVHIISGWLATTTSIIIIGGGSRSPTCEIRFDQIGKEHTFMAFLSCRRPPRTGIRAINIRILFFFYIYAGYNTTGSPVHSIP